MAKGKNCTCGCGCLATIVIGTGIVGTFAVGGVGAAYNAVVSTWDYDNKLQQTERMFDKNNDNVLDQDERIDMYRSLGIPTIDGEVPTVDIPYTTLKKYNNEHEE